MKKSLTVLMTVLITAMLFVSCGEDPFFHTVSIKDDDKVVKTEIVRDGDEYTLPEKVDGIEGISGWTVDGKTYSVGEKIKVTSDITITAVTESEKKETPTTPVTPPVEPKAVATLEELKKAVKTEGSYYLTADITIVGSLDITAPIILDGKNKTINVDYEITCTACNGSPIRTQPCGTCGGTGSYTCSSCNGSGNVDYGEGDETCPDCWGGGTISCPTYETITCSTCNGKGKKAKEDVNTGLVIMSKGVTIKNVKFASSSAGARGNAQLTVVANGTEAKPIVIDTCSFDSSKAIENTFNESAIVSHYASGAYLTVKNCTIKNMLYGMYFNQISNAEIIGNTIDGTKYNGINISADEEAHPCSKVKVENNTLTNISYANCSADKDSCGIFFGKKCSDITVNGNNITMLHDKKQIVQSYLN